MRDQNNIFENPKERDDFFIAIAVIAFFGWLIYSLTGGFSTTDRSLESKPVKVESPTDKNYSTTSDTKGINTPDGYIPANDGGMSVIVPASGVIYVNNQDEYYRLEDTEVSEAPNVMASKEQNVIISVDTMILNDEVSQISDDGEDIIMDVNMDSISTEGINEAIEDSLHLAESTVLPTSEDITESMDDTSEQDLNATETNYATEEETVENETGCIAVVGSFKVKQNADQLAERLKDDGFNIASWVGQTYYTIGVHVSCDPKEYPKVLEKLRTDYSPNAFLYEKKN